MLWWSGLRLLAALLLAAAASAQTCATVVSSYTAALDPPTAVTVAVEDNSAVLELTPPTANTGSGVSFCCLGALWTNCNWVDLMTPVPPCPVNPVATVFSGDVRQLLLGDVLHGHGVEV